MGEKRVYIHKDVIGYKCHMECHEDGTIRSIKGDFPPGKPMIFGEDEIIEVSKVFNLTLPSYPSRNYLKAMRTVLGKGELSQVPWNLVLPREAYIQSVRDLGLKLITLFSDLDLDSYYRTYYRKTFPLLKKLQRAKIDPVAFKFHEMSEEKSAHLESFAPDDSGFAKDVVYSKCDTVTGRLKVTSGPNILHLRKDERNILTSRFGHGEGRIWTLDYKSLEPRTILAIKSYLNSPDTIFGSLPLDLYTHVLNELKLKDVSRESLKEVIITQLYGASRETLLEKLTHVPNREDFISMVNDWFGVETIRERLLQEYEETNRKLIHSWYRRPVDCTTAKPYMLMNRFIQSTAVDVALFGFDSIVRHLEVKGLISGIVPIFILHDALFLDVRKDMEDCLPELAEVGSKNIPLFPGFTFPIKPEPLLEFK